MKKIICLLFGIFIVNAAFAGDVDNLKKWTTEAYMKTCRKHDVGNDQPCIGYSRLLQQSLGGSEVYPGFNNQVGCKFMLIATMTTDGGAYFCPMAVCGLWTSSYSFVYGRQYTLGFYQLNNNCFWLCRDGKTGDKCSQNVSGGAKSCDSSVVKYTQYDSLKSSDLSNSPINVINQIPRFATTSGTYCTDDGMYASDAHMVVLAVSNILDNGHGAYVRPYVVRAKASSNTFNAPGVVDLYPAAGVSGENTSQSPAVLGCKSGYKQNSAKTNCVPITQDVCDGKVWCSGWGSGYDASKHTIKTVGDCLQYRCIGQYQAFPSDSSHTCRVCGTETNRHLYGANPETGVCVTCPQSKWFDGRDSAAGNYTPYCSDSYTLDKQRLHYGNGDKNTAILSQCWTMSSEDYKNCVLKGL